MEKNEIALINRVYQDATVGMLAIDKILKNILFFSKIVLTFPDNLL